MSVQKSKVLCRPIFSIGQCLLSNSSILVFVVVCGSAFCIMWTLINLLSKAKCIGIQVRKGQPILFSQGSDTSTKVFRLSLTLQIIVYFFCFIWRKINIITLRFFRVFHNRYFLLMYSLNISWILVYVLVSCNDSFQFFHLFFPFTCPMLKIGRRKTLFLKYSLSRLLVWVYLGSDLIAR